MAQVANALIYTTYTCASGGARVYERSKIKMKAYTAVQKKLLVIIYTLYTKPLSRWGVLKNLTGFCRWLHLDSGLV